MYKWKMTSGSALQEALAGQRAAAVARQEAQQAGVVEPDLTMVGMKAGWAAMCAMGYEVPPALAAQMQAYDASRASSVEA